MGRLMRDSSTRMLGLIDNMLDLARGRLGGGLTVRRNADEPLEPVLREVIAELKAGQPERVIEAEFKLIEPVNCDRERIAQLFSNLLSNALSYGSTDQPVLVRAISEEGKLRAFSRQCRGADTDRRLGPSVPSLLSQCCAPQPRGTGTRALHCPRDCAGSRRYARGHIHSRGNPIHVPHVGEPKRFLSGASPLLKRDHNVWTVSAILQRSQRAGHRLSRALPEQSD